MYRIILLITFCLLLLPASDLSAQKSYPQILEATHIAYFNFLRKLEKGNDDSWELSEYVSNIKNYNIGISQNKKYYVVVFMLKKTNVKINGGGAQYLIRKSDLQVVDVVGYE